MSEERIDWEVEKTIDLLGSIKRAEADPYLYNKVIGKIEESARSGGRLSVAARLGYACISILIIINLITSAYIYRATESAEDYATYQDFAQEYNLNQDAGLYTGL